MGSHAWPAGGRLGLARDRVMDSRVWVSRVRACPKWERPILTCPMPGPVPNPTEGGVATCQRKPGLMRGATLAWRSELGRSGRIRALFDPQLPLRLEERDPNFF